MFILFYFILLPDECFQTVALHFDFSVSWAHSLNFEELHIPQHNHFKVLSNLSQLDQSLSPSQKQGMATEDSTPSRRGQHFPMSALALLLADSLPGISFLPIVAVLEVISNPTFIKPSLIPTHPHFPTSQVGLLCYVF